MKTVFLLLSFLSALSYRTAAQSADWTEVIWREPQVRYLLADMTGSGETDLYRKYATEEKDPDSREAIGLWDAGVRVINMADFERTKVDRKVFITGQGSTELISGTFLRLSSDLP